MAHRFRTSRLALVLILAFLAVPPRPDAAEADTRSEPAPRIDTADPVDAGVRLSRRAFDPASASHAVLARADVFADSLAGAPLAGTAGPLLLTAPSALDTRVRDELERVLPAGSTVFLLGGDAALSPAVAAGVRDAGYRVTRLSGPSRVETAVAVAETVWARPDAQRDRVALARADDWADSVTGGAWAAAEGVPLLITPTSALHPAARAALDRMRPRETVLLGGEKALSPAVAEEAPGPRRVAGASRAETSVAIADELWQWRSNRHTIVNGFHERGWAFGLTAAPFAAVRGAPLLVVGHDGASEVVMDRVSACADPLTSVVVVGDDTLVSERLRARFTACGGTPVTNGCGVLDQADVAALLGSTHPGESHVHWGDDQWGWTGGCLWDSDQDVRALHVVHYRGATAYDDHRLFEGDRAVPVSGLGEEAFAVHDGPQQSWYGVDLWVKTAERSLRLRWTTRAPSTAEQREQLVEAARIVLGRLD